MLLRCAGRYLLGSGVDEFLIENEVFGKKVLQSVLNETHYVRSLQRLCIVSDMLSLLSSGIHFDPHSMDSVVQLAISTRESFMRKDKVDITINFEALRYVASTIQQQFEDWKKMCRKI